MKYFFGYLAVILLLSSSLFFVSCTKAGQQGPQGPAGAVGPAGKDGSQMYAGAGTPSASLGNAGDYYVDQTADNLYGPKTVSGWGTPFALKGAAGAQGATGTAGSKILSGSGTPATTVGNVGDYYLDATNYLLYGPKTNSGWGGGLMLKGKDGSQFVNTYLFRNKMIALGALTPGGSTAAAVLQVPAITADIISKGAVLAYTDYGTYFGAWYVLPIVQPNYLYITTTRIEPGDIGISVYFPMDNISSITADFEVVVIQGASVTQLAAANPNVNFNDYNQVASLFRLNK